MAMTTSDPKPLPFDRMLPILVLTFVDVLGLTVIIPILHLYAAAYNATPLQIGLVAAAFPLSQLIGVPLMGALSDRFGRKPLLLISQISTLIGFLMLAAATSLEMVILSRVIDGVFGANYATAQAAITDLTDDSNRARGLGLAGAAFGIGFLFGPAIALFALEINNSLSMPALVAAAYSAFSIGLTVFSFRETLSRDRRKQGKSGRGVLFSGFSIIRRPAVTPLLVLMFFQQIIFFAFETLLGLFLLSRFGILGQGSALIFLYVGVILVMAQGRLIGQWSRRYGERRVVQIALALLAVGLVLVAASPDAPHPFYVERIVRNELRDLAPTATETVIGDIAITLPSESGRGFGGLLWLAAALVPLTLGAGLIRPALNSLMIRRVQSDERGAVLGVSASFVSAADSAAPLLGGLLFQSYGASAPFFVGGGIMAVLWLLSFWLIRREPPREQGGG